MTSCIHRSLCVFALLILGNTAGAQIVVSIDADPSTPDVIDSSRVVSAGQSISVNLVIELGSAADSLSIYGITVRFDNHEVELDGAAIENDPSLIDPGNPLSPFAPGGLDQTNDRSPVGLSGTDDGQVRSFEAWNLFSAAVGPRRWVAGSIPLSVVTVADDGLIDIRPLLVGSDALLDSASSPVAAVFNGAVLVPEPATACVVCFGAATIAVVLRRRRS